MDDGTSDAELLELAADDPDAFGLLYERHAATVLSWFYRRTGCAQTAADLTAETFAAAFASRRRFRDVGAPGRAWLFRIAHRQLARFIRTERVDERARGRLGISRAILDDADLERVEQLVDLAPGQAMIEAAIAGLPGGQREALRLRVIDGLSFAEVGLRIGCSEGAARVRVSRALSTLCVQLSPGDLP